jgi:hypothetical protein
MKKVLLAFVAGTIVGASTLMLYAMLLEAGARSDRAWRG